MSQLYFIFMKKKKIRKEIIRIFALRREYKPELCVHDIAVPSKQTTLQRENIPDEMDAEQTWPTEEEIAQAQAETKKMKLIKRVPKGMSDYQACWIPDVEEKECNSDEGSDDENGSGSDSDSDDFMSCNSEADSADEFEKGADDGVEVESVAMSEAQVNDDKYDLDMDLQEERETWEKIKEARTDQFWPDEIDTPLNIPARTRFQKYRGLESFRTSPWDVKENLPIDYARIYQFQNFDRTKRRILNEYKEREDLLDVTPSTYISIHVANVPLRQYQQWQATQADRPVLIVYGLLPHEHQMSVVNVVLKRTSESNIPIKSKERLIIQCGYRRFIVNPIFSQHTNSDRHKVSKRCVIFFRTFRRFHVRIPFQFQYERYFRQGETVVATFYAPIQFPPAPVLCFQENPDTTLRLVATGVLLSCNPDRVILKRIVLSGHPLKVSPCTVN